MVSKSFKRQKGVCDFLDVLWLLATLNFFLHFNINCNDFIRGMNIYLISLLWP